MSILVMEMYLTVAHGLNGDVNCDIIGYIRRSISCAKELIHASHLELLVC